jgi:pSer/pThr/pTyr-binding forkhead associated (FHA) protein
MGVRLTIAPTQSTSPTAASTAISVDRDAPWEFDQARIVLGRGGSSDVVLPDVSVSTRHATIEADGVRYTIVDHGSLNGTRVNGARIVAERKKPLRDGDIVELGLFRVVFTANVAVRNAPSRERTASLARKLLQSVRANAAPLSPQRIVFVHGPEAGQSVALAEAPARMILGRAEDAEIRLSDADASREHAELQITFEGVVLVDLGSKNGFSVNGERTTQKRLSDRDELTIGSTVLVFESDLEPSWKALEHLPEVRMPEPTPEPAVPSLSASPTAPEAEDAAPVKAADAAEGESESEAEKPTKQGESEPAQASALSRVPTVEWVVYALALLVFAVSAVGLAWLLHIV